ncbi:MAG: phage major tail tube protein [Mailhella sp.]|nr:phage major tail tube protein [Mailhella sp.]
MFTLLSCRSFKVTSSKPRTVSGAGIGGEVEFPVLGHYQSMTCTLHWKGIEKDAFALSAFKSHALELRGSQQEYASGTSEIVTVPVRVVLRAVPKNLNLGSFQAGAQTEAESEFEVTYMKVYVNGKEVCEIDKFNFIAKFGGVDYLASVRKDLGMS